MDPSNLLVIETRHLSKVYKEVQALKDLNLRVKQHSIFGFLGPNGAGKTTTSLIWLMRALLPIRKMEQQFLA